MSEVIPFRRGLKPQELSLSFIDSVGHKKDAADYLSIFQAQKPESFAFIVLDEESLKGDLDSVIFDLRYLVKMSLFPVVLVHASEDTLDEVNVEHHFERARMIVNFLADDLNPLEKIEFIKKSFETLV